MHRTKAISFTLFLSFFLYNSTLYSQEDSVRYEKGFVFNNGIYKSFEDFKKNSPSISENAVIKENKPLRILFGEVDEYLSYNTEGETIKLRKDSVWGYCDNNNIYVYFHNTYNQVFIKGAIFIINKTGTGGYSYGSGSLSTNQGAMLYSHKDSDSQYLLEYKSGKIYKYNTDVLSSLIKDDKELYNKLNSIKKKKEKEKSIFMFVNEYNKRNPIYFPSTQ